MYFDLLTEFLKKILYKNFLKILISMERKILYEYYKNTIMITIYPNYPYISRKLSSLIYH